MIVPNVTESNPVPFILPAPFLSLGSYDLARLVCFIPLKFLFSAIGIFTNIFSTFVFCKLGFSTPSNVGLFSLCIFDFLCICLMFLSDLAARPLNVGSTLYMSLADVSYLINPIFWSASTLRSWAVLIVGVEKCCSTLSPAMAKRVFGRGSTAGMLLGMLAYQGIHMLLQFLAVKITVITWPFVNRTNAVYDWFNRNENLANLSTVVFYSVPTALCFCVVLFCAIFLAVKLKSNKTPKEDESSGEKKGDDTMRAVLSVCIIHVICFLPNVLVFLTSLAYSKFSVFDLYLGTFTSLMIDISYLFQCVSQSINFFFYYKLMVQFNQTFKKSFCKK